MRYLIVALILVAPLAYGVTGRFWSGGTDSTWTTLGNWASVATGRIPDSVGEYASFAGTSRKSPVVNSTANGYNIARIELGDSGWNITGQFSGYSLVLCGDDGTGTVAFTTADATTNSLSLVTNMKGNGNMNLDWNIGGQLTVNRAISSQTGSGINKTGSGTMILAGNCAYTGSTVIANGSLVLNTASNTLSASSPIVINGGSLSSPTYTNYCGTLTVGANSGYLAFDNIQFADSSTNVWSNMIRLTGNWAPNKLRFGTTSTGLTEAQKRLLRYNGKRMSLDANGYVVFDPKFNTIELPNLLE